MKTKNEISNWWLVVACILLALMCMLFGCSSMIANISVSMTGQVEEVTTDDREYNKFIDETSSLNLQIRNDSIKVMIGR